MQMAVVDVKLSRLAALRQVFEEMKEVTYADYMFFPANSEVQMLHNACRRAEMWALASEQTPANKATWTQQGSLSTLTTECIPCMVS